MSLRGGAAQAAPPISVKPAGVMDVSQDEGANAVMGRGLRIALRVVQAGLLVYAACQLFGINRDEVGVLAFAWSIPWVISFFITLLLVPTLVRLGWRRFGRLFPTWAIATIISIMSWVVATMLCWKVLGIVLLLAD